MRGPAGDSRRRFIRLATGTGALVTGVRVLDVKAAAAAAQTAREEDISPAEDLMREHGVLRRVLLVYEEALRRVESRQELDPAVLTGCAGIVRRFVEDYHEKLEEREIFPRFEKAGTLVDLVRVLRAQHQAGRRVTDEIRTLATASALRSEDGRRHLAEGVRQFIRMYRPHAAREDTVLFPALHGLVSPSEYDALGERFEDQEHELLGGEGFEKAVDEVTSLEKQVGIADLAAFTPR
jgi:hemerythrin-like domain-containing protein